MEKASELSKLLYKTIDDTPFTASVGFQWRFCQRYGIRNLAVVGENLSANAEAAKQFIKYFPDLTNGYSLHQIYKWDETGLYFKILPGRTMVIVNDESAGGKKAKELVTINAFANASGTIKLPLLLIGKTKNPQYLRGINQSALPVVYKNQKNAWINTNIFRDWFHKTLCSLC